MTYLKRLALLSLGLMVFLSCRSRKPWQETRYALGTEVQIKFYNPDDRIYAESFFNEIDRLESLFSRSRKNSDAQKISRTAGMKAVSVAPETLQLASAADHFYQISGGLFDPTIAPLVDLWGIGTNHARIPDQKELDGVIPLIDAESMMIDPDKGTVYLLSQGMGVEFGAIAKGFIAEYMTDFLKRKGVTSGLINLGGNVRVLGEKPNGEPYIVSVQDPLGPRGRSAGLVSIRDGSVVTSGVYERYFEKDGQRYHHILNPRTGFPAQTGLLSVTIITHSGTDADGLSTVVFLLGPEEGLSLIERTPGTECVLITESNEMILSSGAGKFFTPLEDSPYRIKE